MSATQDSSGGGSAPRRDPTQTTTLRNRLHGRLSQRVRDVRGQVREQIESGEAATPAAVGALAAGVGGLAMFASLGAFRRWLSGLFDRFVIETTPQQAVRRGDHWTASFVRSAYEAGLRQSRSALRGRDYPVDDRPADAVINDERHQTALTDLYEQAYFDLRDASENTQQEVRRAVTDGGFIERDAEGIAQSDAVETINERIRANFGKRHRVVAQIEPVRAANEAAIQAYQRAGVEEVGVEPEAAPDGGEDEDEDVQDVDWETANDDRVCAKCIALARDAPYRLTAVIAGNAPRPIRNSHLGCRCYLLPL